MSLESERLILFRNLWHVSWPLIAGLVFVCATLAFVRYEVSERRLEHVARVAQEQAESKQHQEEEHRLVDMEAKRADEMRLQQLAISEAESRRKEDEARVAADAERRRADEELRREQTEARLKAAEKLQEVVTGLVAPAYAKKKGFVTALVAFESDKGYALVLSERLSKALGNMGVSNDWRVFRPAFMKSPYFNELLSGSYKGEEDFKVSDFCDKLLVIQTRSVISKIEQPAEMLSGEVVLSIRLISTADGQVEDAFEIRAKGVGFNESDTTENAFDRAIHELGKVSPRLAAEIQLVK
jgi:hypothetical protein